MSQTHTSSAPDVQAQQLAHARITRARVIQLISAHFARGDLKRAGAHAHYWSQRLDTHPYLEQVVTRAFDAIRRAQRGEPWQVRAH